MDRFIEGAIDARSSYEAMEARRCALPTRRFPPAPRQPIAGTWSPQMTEAERQEFAQYVIDNNLPF